MTTQGQEHFLIARYFIYAAAIYKINIYFILKTAHSTVELGFEAKSGAESSSLGVSEIALCTAYHRINVMLA